MRQPLFVIIIKTTICIIYLQQYTYCSYRLIVFLKQYYYTDSDIQYVIIYNQYLTICILYKSYSTNCIVYLLYSTTRILYRKYYTKSTYIKKYTTKSIKYKQYIKNYRKPENGLRQRFICRGSFYLFFVGDKHRQTTKKNDITDIY